MEDNILKESTLDTNNQNSIISIITKYCGQGIMESHAKWRFTCPQCHSDRALNVNPVKSHGPFICNACGFRGATSTIAKSIGVEFSYEPQKLVEKNWDLIFLIYNTLIRKSELREYHYNWLLSRGVVALPQTQCQTHPIQKSKMPIAIKDEVSIPCMASMRLYSSDTAIDVLLREFNKDNLVHAGLMSYVKGKYTTSGVLKPNRIIIPYLDSTGSCYYIRSRFAGTTDTLRYLAPVGVPARDVVWGWETVPQNSPYVGVTEGEFKAQVMKQLGWHWVALPGMQTSHDAFVNECISRKIKTVYIMFDSESGYTSSDIPKQDGIDDSIYRLATKLNNAKIDTFNCRLPLLNKPKMDIDGFILNRGDTSKTELLNIIKTSERIK